MSPGVRKPVDAKGRRTAQGGNGVFLHNSGLKSRFLNFERLLRALEEDNLTGFVNLRSRDDDIGRGGSVLLMKQGKLIDYVRADGTVVAGEVAARSFLDDANHGDGLVDVGAVDPATFVDFRWAVVREDPPPAPGLLRAGLVLLPTPVRERWAEERLGHYEELVSASDRRRFVLSSLRAILGLVVVTRTQRRLRR